MTNKPVVNEKLLSILDKVYKRATREAEVEVFTDYNKEELPIMQAHDQIIELFREDKLLERLEKTNNLLIACLGKLQPVDDFYSILETTYKHNKQIIGDIKAITEAEKKIGGER